MDYFKKLSVVLGIAMALSGSMLSCAKTVTASDYFKPENQLALAVAAAKGQVRKIDQLLSEGATVNFQGKEGMTALIWALIKSNRRGFQHLLEKGANPNLCMSESKITSDEITDGNSAVSLAAISYDPWFLKTVLKYGGNPNIVNSVSGETPIFQCITLLNRLDPHPMLDQLKLLIAAGANVNAIDRFDETPLMEAVDLNRYDMAYLLLKAGADPREKSNSGTTVVWNIENSRISPTSELYKWREKVIVLLNEKGIIINAKDEST